ncbi:MAG: hypothetical protein RLZZ70_270 [Candidatus Parcubacteria bacterium]|jgi:hypothetical protein
MDRSNENTRPRFIKGQSSFGKMLMSVDQYHDMKSRQLWWSFGNWEDVDSALRLGVRIFLFVPDDHLEQLPYHRPFVTGTWSDLEAMIGGGKIHVEDKGNCIINPLQNVWKEACNPQQQPMLRLSMVSVRDFRQAFGMKRFTSLIPKDVWSPEV